MTWLRCAQLLAREAPSGATSIAPLREILHLATDPDLRQAIAESTAAIPEIRALANRIAESL
jgi:hypothetical protein